MKVSLIYWPKGRELTLLKRCTWVTMGRTEEPRSLPTSKLLRDLLRARHSPIRVLNYAFLIEGIPSNTATHLARHVHAQPFISSLRNDRQGKIDGDAAPRNTPVDMILYVNAEELQVIANKRLCGKAAEEATPELKGLLVPMCYHCGGVCYEDKPCGKYRNYARRKEAAK